MKIMPLTIINIFAVMEIIGLFRHSPKASYGNEGNARDKVGQCQVISLVDCFTSFAMTSLTGTIYFLAMIMAKNLFLVFGIILISAFYLIEKLKKINLCQRFSVGEGEQK